MIPLKLSLSGFLSYRTPVELDFTMFQLACISGHNGAGKSSLLDAFTWSLFGEARKRGEELINAACDTAEVLLTFAYEGDTYRVRRSLTRGKSTVLEFQIQHNGRWKPLTETTTRATQARIESILRLDYDTFVNASFFLQGKADQFAQQKASERKRILGSILGLERWETYRERAAERRKVVEAELNQLEGRLKEINDELAQESARRASLNALEHQLKQVQSLLAEREARYRQAETMRNLLENQREQVRKMEAELERSRRDLHLLRGRLAEREAESGHQMAFIQRAAEIEARYLAWQASREELARWEALSGQFREAEKRRQPLLDTIHAERARLEQERQLLHNQASSIGEQQKAMEMLKSEIEQAENALREAETCTEQRKQVEQEWQEKRELLKQLQTENSNLKLEMDALKTRLDRVSALEDATCPLCGQPLTEQHRDSLAAQLRVEGKEKGDRWRLNREVMKTLEEQIRILEQQAQSLADVDNERVRRAAKMSSLQERLRAAEKAIADWQNQGLARLEEVEQLLSAETFAPEARLRLFEIERELAVLGYDPAAHDALRKAEQEGRTVEQEWLELAKARAALEPLAREIADLRSQIQNLQSLIDNQEDAYAQAVVALQQAESEIPDFDQAERDFYDVKEQEADLMQRIGAARQLVEVLEKRRAQKKQVEADREACALEIGRFKRLERAFGKDGVPALLIEQALPQIEEKANELLDRLSNGTMSVRFITQAGYRDRKREDLKETLDIQISDGAGVRDYEMFSGGEAFRVNFAIRLALAEVLAQRTGARLQTLFIDEGFGSQDALGRQRLVEAINAVRRDFAKILIITHLDDLKDAFPNRIEVEKTPQGSRVRVI
ncbi:MAG: SMC family ATPase [Anaerolineales bacterium]|nr:SMC family ATPase [Anaerolineales bacterium]MCX7755873.1 SMC family ATPase [Anaerolineales bacterium]MDW8277963.1 SMC family ATPase [Anaerolineales bacterium]